MKLKYILLSISLLFIAACEDDNLSRVCQSPRPCIINNGKIITDNLKDSIGTCQKGITSCDAKNEMAFCEGFIGQVNEICDGLDNDCDGLVDEGHDGDGDGYNSCDNDCNDNIAEINPGGIEICDGFDNDCNGVIDNYSRDCWTGPAVDSYISPSVCRTGKQRCTHGVWGQCTGVILPTPETCDGFDNNCDGITDEEILDSCGPSSEVGLCQLGTQICTSEETYCVGAVHPSPEICDGFDNDCNGAIDEGLERLCRTSCESGIESCNVGNWIGCNARKPVREICDGFDNDCDGIIDEDCACTVGDARVCRQNVLDHATGELINCGTGISICDSNGVWGTCYSFATEPEVCNNWDDDCDGTIDELTDACGDPATAGIGQCVLGERTCTSGIWSSCIGPVYPEQESCDGVDNDCDGLIDEDLTPHDKVDIIFVIDGSGSMTQAMFALQAGISNYVADFQGTEHRFGLVVFPGRRDNYNVLVNLVDFTVFSAALNNLTASYPGVEPSYDVVHDLANSTNPALINWRESTVTSTGAYPYIILITDEAAQTVAGFNESDVALNTSNCGVGICTPGDAYEMYIITQTQFFLQWDSIVFNDVARLIELYPLNASRYTNILRGIFSNVCR